MDFTPYGQGPDPDQRPPEERRGWLFPLFLVLVFIAVATGLIWSLAAAGFGS